MLARTGWCGTLWCISQAAAQPLADLKQVRIVVAPAPHEAALIGAIAGRRPRAPAPDAAAGRYRRLIQGAQGPANDNEGFAGPDQ